MRRVTRMTLEEFRGATEDLRVASLAAALPDKSLFLVREVQQYLPVPVSLMTIYRWIESGELIVVGPKYKQRITRLSLLKKISQF